MKIVFPCTNRVHASRQKLLLRELNKDFTVDIFEPRVARGEMTDIAISYSKQFKEYIKGKDYDLALIRGDRFELLGIAMTCAYSHLPIAHIEAGDESGVVDNKVRHAISKLSDYHFATNKEAQIRLVNMGVDPDTVYNYGSLDVEFAMQVEPKHLRSKPYILVAYHPIIGESYKDIDKAVSLFSVDYDIIKIVSNKDYGKGYGEETYSPEDYVNLLRYASCLVGNSSSFLKEASIFGTPVVNIGSRQQGRLKPKNVLDVECNFDRIELAIHFQLVNEYEPDKIYYKENTSKLITKALKEIIHS